MDVLTCRVDTRMQSSQRRRPGAPALDHHRGPSTRAHRSAQRRLTRPRPGRLRRVALTHAQRSARQHLARQQRLMRPASGRLRRTALRRSGRAPPSWCWREMRTWTAFCHPCRAWSDASTTRRPGRLVWCVTCGRCVLALACQLRWSWPRACQRSSAQPPLRPAILSLQGMHLPATSICPKPCTNPLQVPLDISGRQAA